MTIKPESYEIMRKAAQSLRVCKNLTASERIGAAQELEAVAKLIEADVREMRQQLEAGHDAVRAVVTNWVYGDLANAVNLAESWADDLQMQFPDFDYEDKEG